MTADPDWYWTGPRDRLPLPFVGVVDPRFRMAPFRPGFALYHLVNLETGIPLYRTCATETEITQANSNLRMRGLASRFVPETEVTAQAA